MSHFDDNLPDMLDSLSEFEEVQKAIPDSDGLIEGPLIPLRDLVIFPHMMMPLFVGREKSLQAIYAAEDEKSTIICAVQNNSDIEVPTGEDIKNVGVEIAIGRTLPMPDGTLSVMVQGLRRVEIVEHTQSEPHYRVRARPIEESETISTPIKALMRVILTLFDKVVDLSHNLPEDAYTFAANIKEPGWLADLVATTLDLGTEERQKLLETYDVEERLTKMSLLLGKEIEVLELEDEIHDRVQDEMDKTQREMLLREQMRAIQTELGEGDPFQQEISELKERVEEMDVPETVQAKARKEVSRLSAIPPMSPETGVIRSYLDWLLDLPWKDRSEDNLDIKEASIILDAEHYGIEKAKDRILEHMAVKKLAGDKMKSPILCFVGPPGTGKTSLGKSIAKALGREFVRISLGGVTDESEIRGHRRTYIGAMPGRIIQTMRRAGTNNPLFMLDEIDKLGSDFRGDPSSALLEVLDPEQNSAFSDHYLELDFDLSDVMFVTTANLLDPIPPALRDRLEIIEFPGYIEEEKLLIAKQFLIPKQIEQHGFAEQGIRFDEGAIRGIIRQYTYESGVRNLEREIANICRKVARRIAEEKSYPKRITAESLVKYLGPGRVSEPLLAEKPEVGLALGLAWTQIGGEVLPVEVTVMPGKGIVTLTGQLGEVMQESAQAAISYMRSQAETLNLDPAIFDETDIHVHLPEGAIPKDGPSAGITLATALISAYTGRPVRHDLVMTGEITLRGRVLPVGGVKEKTLAAHRVGIVDVILPAKNKQDIEEIPSKARKRLNFILVETMDQVLEAALLPVPEKKVKKKTKPSKAARAKNQQIQGQRPS